MYEEFTAYEIRKALEFLDEGISLPDVVERLGRHSRDSWAVTILRYRSGQYKNSKTRRKRLLAHIEELIRLGATSSRELSELTKMTIGYTKIFLLRAGIDGAERLRLRNEELQRTGRSPTYRLLRYK